MAKKLNTELCTVCQMLRRCSCSLFRQPSTVIALGLHSKDRVQPLSSPAINVPHVRRASRQYSYKALKKKVFVSIAGVVTWGSQRQNDRGQHPRNTMTLHPNPPGRSQHCQQLMIAPLHKAPPVSEESV